MMIINLIGELIFVAPFGPLLVGTVVFFVTRRRRLRAENQQPACNDADAADSAE